MMRLLSIIVQAAASIILIASNCAAQIRLDPGTFEPPGCLAPPPAGQSQTASPVAQFPPLFRSPEPLTPAAQPQTSLTLETLEALALANSPAVDKAEAEVRALRGKWLQSGLYPNPVLGYSGDEMGDAGTAGKQGAFLQQELVTSGKLGARREVVAREIEQAEQQLNVQKLRVLIDI